MIPNSPAFKRAKRLCPQHGKMVYEQNSYGGLWRCQHSGCDVICWNGPTSLPADQGTRDARNALHRRFDPLWEDEHGPFSQGHRPNRRGVRRHRAYRWLSQILKLGINETHIGFLSAVECARVNEALDHFMHAAKQGVGEEMKP